MMRFAAAYAPTPTTHVPLKQVLGSARTRAPYIGWSDETVAAMREWLKENYPEFVYPG